MRMSHEHYLGEEHSRQEKHVPNALKVRKEPDIVEGNREPVAGGDKGKNRAINEFGEVSRQQTTQGLVHRTDSGFLSLFVFFFN